MKKNQIFPFITGVVCILSVLFVFVALGWWQFGLGLFVLLSVIAFFNHLKEKNEKTCKKCKVKYDFDNDVSYRQIDRKIKVYPRTETTKPTSIREEETLIVEFNCTCPTCHESKSYRKKIPGAKIMFNGDYAEGDPEFYIEEYFCGSKKSRTKEYVGMWIFSILMIVFGCLVLSGAFSDLFGNLFSSYNSMI